MKRRGFIFGAGATLAVIASPALMRVSSRLLIPEPVGVIRPGIRIEAQDFTAVAWEVGAKFTMDDGEGGTRLYVIADMVSDGGGREIKFDPVSGYLL